VLRPPAASVAAIPLIKVLRSIHATPDRLVDNLCHDARLNEGHERGHRYPDIGNKATAGVRRPQCVAPLRQCDASSATRQAAKRTGFC
jgi:hypothetical protein